MRRSYIINLIIWSVLGVLILGDAIDEGSNHLVVAVLANLSALATFKFIFKGSFKDFFKTF